jgi:hypothetical protein
LQIHADPRLGGRTPNDRKHHQQRACDRPHKLRRRVVKSVTIPQSPESASWRAKNPDINYLHEEYGQFWADADLSYQILKAGKKMFLIPDARAVVHPAEDLDFSSSARALLDADRATGASRYASKYFGFMSGLGITVGAALHSIGQMLAFRDPGFQASRLIGILSRTKVDGTQTSL